MILNLKPNELDYVETYLRKRKKTPLHEQERDVVFSILQKIEVGAAYAAEKAARKAKKT